MQKCILCVCKKALMVSIFNSSNCLKASFFIGLLLFENQSWKMVQRQHRLNNRAKFFGKELYWCSNSVAQSPVDNMHTPKNKCCIYKSCLYNIIKGSYEATQAKHAHLRNMWNPQMMYIYWWIQTNWHMSLEC